MFVGDKTNEKIMEFQVIKEVELNQNVRVTYKKTRKVLFAKVIIFDPETEVYVLQGTCPPSRSLYQIRVTNKPFVCVKSDFMSDMISCISDIKVEKIIHIHKAK